MSDFRLEHANIPSQNPHEQAKWYAETFELSADRHVVRGDGVLIAFQQGTPIHQPEVLHIGFRVRNMAKLHEWRDRFDKALKLALNSHRFKCSTLKVIVLKSTQRMKPLDLD